MAIEVRELIIRVTVQDDSAARVPALATTAALAPNDLRQLREELTQTCVRQVLAELQRRRER